MQNGRLVYPGADLGFSRGAGVSEFQKFLENVADFFLG